MLLGHACRTRERQNSNRELKQQRRERERERKREREQQKAIGLGPVYMEVTCGGSPHLSCKRDQIKMRYGQVGYLTYLGSPTSM